MDRIAIASFLFLFTTFWTGAITFREITSFRNVHPTLVQPGIIKYSHFQLPYDGGG
jgi:hypothetical protein